ncbi:hypothetical protein ACFW04_008824 [Cataglyphis niger]
MNLAHFEKNTKAKKDDAMRKILRPKAGGNLERVVKNVQHILKRISSTKHKPKKFKVHKLRQRGIVYVEQMKVYFKQFGNVTRHFGFFMGINWSEDKYPKLRNRRQIILHKNCVQSAEVYRKYIENLLNKLSVLEDKLHNKGINIKFQPIDVPNK